MRWLATGVLAVTLLTAGLTGQSDSGTFVIRNVRVFDGETVAERQTVVIGEGRITAVGSAVSAPAGALEIPGTGRTLLPGLMDAHIHLPIFSLTTTAALQQSLAFGVTTTVVMAAAPSQFASRLKEIEAADAPDLAALLSAGTAATAPGGHPTQMGGPGFPTLTAPGEAAAFVAARIAEGSDFIKIIHDDTNAAYGRTLPTLSEATVAALASAAHAQGRLAVAHIGTEQQAMRAIDAGVDGLAHLFVGPTVSPEFVQDAKRRNVFVIPTLSILYSVCGQSDGQQILDDARVMSLVRPQFRAPLDLPAGGIQPSCAGAKAAVRQLAAAGVPIVAGTDAPGPGTTYGASLHWELIHLVDAGMTPTAALAAATSAAARAFHLTDRGRIAPGLRADLLLVDGDPSTEIRATRNIVRIWKKGVTVPPTSN